jgi:hypothetical protein
MDKKINYEKKNDAIVFEASTMQLFMAHILRT